MLTFLLLTLAICTLSEVLWYQPMNSSDFSGWSADGNSVSYRSSDSTCPYSYKCWKMCGELAGDWTSQLTHTIPISTVGKMNTKLTFDISTTSFTNKCSIEWSTDNIWNNVNEIVSKSQGFQNTQAQTVTFTAADDKSALYLRVSVFEGNGDCCFISRFVLEADPIASTAPTAPPSNIPTVPTAQPTNIPTTVPTTPYPTDVPTTPYPTTADGTAIRVITGTWNDDYCITTPIKWYATRDTSDYGSTEYTPPILTGDDGKYHGNYEGDVNNYGVRYYMSLYQKFVCSTHATIDMSFTVIACGTESSDNFYFYLNNVEQESFTLSIALSWSSVSDSAISCSGGSPEQKTFTFIDVLEVFSNTEAFEVKFNIDTDSENEAILVTNIAITCNIITSNPTTNPTDSTVTPTNIPTHSPLTIAPTIPTANPVNITPYPTNTDGVSIRIISGSWDDDYSILNPFKWQALMEDNNPPTTTIAPPIFTGNEGIYHGPYQSSTDGRTNYAILWQQFRCDTYSMVDVSFLFLVCGSESSDYFEFYFNDIISSDGRVSLAPTNWDSINDALLTCTDPDSNSQRVQRLFSYNNMVQVQPTDIFELKFFMRFNSDNEALWINNITVTCRETIVQPTTNPTTPYPTVVDGSSIRIIHDIWKDDYVTSNPLKWEAFKSMLDPPTTTITPYIYSGDMGQYHGPYQSDGSSGRFYFLLWQKFRCAQRSIIHLSFTLIICGTENTDTFTFYFDDTASSDGTIGLSISSNNWNAVDDAAIGCSSGAAEQHTYNYTNLREVQSSDDIFVLKFRMVTDSTNEALWITDVNIICDAIITNNPSTIPTNNPSINPTTHPTVSTNNPTTTPTQNPTYIPTVPPTIKNPTSAPTKTPTKIPTITPTRNPSPYPTTLNPSFTPTTRPSFKPTTYPSSTITPTNSQGQVGDATTMSENDSTETTNQNLQNLGETNRSYALFIYIGIAMVPLAVCIIVAICIFKIKKRKKQSDLSKIKDTSDHESNGTIQMEMVLTHGLKKVNSNSEKQIEIEYGAKTNGNENGMNGAMAMSLTAEGIVSYNDFIIGSGGHETLGGLEQNDDGEFIVEDDESDNYNDILVHQTIGGTLQDEGDEDIINEVDDQYQTKGNDVIDDLLSNDEFIIE